MVEFSPYIDVCVKHGLSDRYPKGWLVLGPVVINCTVPIKASVFSICVCDCIDILLFFKRVNQSLSLDGFCLTNLVVS